MRAQQKRPIGRRLLASWRAGNGWSPADVAAALAAGYGIRVSRGYLYRVESGERELVSLELAVALEDLAQVPVESWPAFVALPRLLELRSKRAAA